VGTEWSKSTYVVASVRNFSLVNISMMKMPSELTLMWVELTGMSLNQSIDVSGNSIESSFESFQAFECQARVWSFATFKSSERKLELRGKLKRHSQIYQMKSQAIEASN
jgi:hypothetical protein